MFVHIPTCYSSRVYEVDMISESFLVATGTPDSTLSNSEQLLDGFGTAGVWTATHMCTVERGNSQCNPLNRDET